MDKADYKGGSTWDRVFSQRLAMSAGWDSDSTFEFTWTGENSTEARQLGGTELANALMSDDNPFKDDKHATLIGHSHGGNVNKEAKNILEENGWTVDIINIATPQRTDHETNKSESGVYVNFYNNNDAVQYAGAKPKTAKDGARKDSNAQVNKEIDPSLLSWFGSSGGHSYHQNSSAQRQMEKAVKKAFKEK